MSGPCDCVSLCILCCLWSELAWFYIYTYVWISLLHWGSLHSIEVSRTACVLSWCLVSYSLCKYEWFYILSLAWDWLQPHHRLWDWLWVRVRRIISTIFPFENYHYRYSLHIWDTGGGWVNLRTVFPGQYIYIYKDKTAVRLCCSYKRNTYTSNTSLYSIGSLVISHDRKGVSFECCSKSYNKGL